MRARLADTRAAPADLEAERKGEQVSGQRSDTSCDPSAEAAEALTDLSLAIADLVAATERVLDARHRLAAAHARLAHPTPPLRAIEGGLR